MAQGKIDLNLSTRLYTPFLPSVGKSCRFRIHYVNLKKVEAKAERGDLFYLKKEMTSDFSLPPFSGNVHKIGKRWGFKLDKETGLSLRFCYSEREPTRGEEWDLARDQDKYLKYLLKKGIGRACEHEDVVELHPVIRPIGESLPSKVLDEVNQYIIDRADKDDGGQHSFLTLSGQWYLSRLLQDRASQKEAEDEFVLEGLSKEAIRLLSRGPGRSIHLALRFKNCPSDVFRYYSQFSISRYSLLMNPFTPSDVIEKIASYAFYRTIPKFDLFLTYALLLHPRSTKKIYRIIGDLYRWGHFATFPQEHQDNIKDLIESGKVFTADIDDLKK